MTKYRLGNDFLFLPMSTFSYKGDLIGSMAVNVLFKVLNKDKQEILFESSEAEDQKLYFDGGDCYLDELVICSFDRVNVLDFTINEPLLEKFKGELQLEWEIHSYDKHIDKGIFEPELITEAEFMDIMRNNINTFDNSNNRSTQTTSYFTEVIEENTSNTNKEIIGRLGTGKELDIYN